MRLRDHDQPCEACDNKLSIWVPNHTKWRGAWVTCKSCRGRGGREVTINYLPILRLFERIHHGGEPCRTGRCAELAETTFNAVLEGGEQR